MPSATPAPLLQPLSTLGSFSGSPNNPSQNSSPRRDQIVSSPLRSHFNEQRDAVFFKFGMRIDQVRKKFDDKIKPLRVIAFSDWGSTSPTDFPDQLGQKMNLVEVVKFLIPHIQSAVVQMHATTFLRLLTVYPNYVALLQDTFWYFFLEFYALAEVEERFDKHRLLLLEKLQDDQAFATNSASARSTKRTAKESNAVVMSDSVAGSDTLDAEASILASLPPINGTHPLWKKRLSYNAKDASQAKKERKKVPPRPIDELLEDEDDDEPVLAPNTFAILQGTALSAKALSTSMAQSPTTPRVSRLEAQAAEAQERKKTEFMKKLKRRQLVLLPSHVMSNQEAYHFKYVGDHTHATTLESGRTSSPPRDVDSSIASSPNHRSRPDFEPGDDDFDCLSRAESEMSLVSMPESSMSTHSHGDDDDDDRQSSSDFETRTNVSRTSSASRHFRSGDLNAQLKRAAQGPRLRCVRGEKNFAQSLAILVEAEELELSETELIALQQEVLSKSPEGLAKGQAVINLACDLVSREQFRMFGRMARNYVTSMEELSEPLRRMIAPTLPDIIARIVVQLLYLLAPYSRDLLTRRVRKVVKRKITYWMGGVESSSVEQWNETVGVPMDEQHKTELHAYHKKRWEQLGSSLTKPIAVPNSTEVGLIHNGPTHFNLRKSTAVFNGEASGGRRMSASQSSMSPQSLSVTVRSGASQTIQTPRPPPMPPGGLASSVNSVGSPLSIATVQAPRRSLVHRGSASGSPVSANLTSSPSGGRALHHRSALQVPSTRDGNAGSNDGAGGAENQPGGDPPATGAFFAWTPGAVAYHRALDDILNDFAKVRSGLIIEGAKQQPNKPATASSSGKSRGGGAGGRSGHKKSGASAEDVKHLETHRHAPANRRAELWHEQGRASYAAVNSESRSRQGHFDMGNFSPFMKRYLKDCSVESRMQQNTVTRLIRWTSS